MAKKANIQKKDQNLDTLSIYKEEYKDLVDLTIQEDKKTKRPIHVRVSAHQGESAEQMLRRFNFAVQEVVQKIKDIQFYEKPSKRRQREGKMRSKLVRRYGR